MPSEEGLHRGGLSVQHVRWSVEQSLRRLGVEHVDLLQLHLADTSTPIDETLAALEQLVAAGLVRAVGCSNFWAWEVAEAITIAEAAGLPRLASVSAEWSLLHREPERELVPAARHFGFGILPYRPLAQGFLTGKYRPGSPPPPGSRLDLVPATAELRLSASNFAVLERLESYAAARGTDVLTLAIGYLLDHSEVASVVVGASSVAQVTALVAAAMRAADRADDVGPLRPLLPELGGHLLGMPELRPVRSADRREC
jgi:aryl-alcohol dehydrogenase-like predicted oxidoreductase